MSLRKKPGEVGITRVGVLLPSQGSQFLCISDTQSTVWEGLWIRLGTNDGNLELSLHPFLSLSICRSEIVSPLPPPLKAATVNYPHSWITILFAGNNTQSFQTLKTSPNSLFPSSHQLFLFCPFCLPGLMTITHFSSASFSFHRANAMGRLCVFILLS